MSKRFYQNEEDNDFTYFYPPSYNCPYEDYRFPNGPQMIPSGKFPQPMNQMPTGDQGPPTGTPTGPTTAPPPTPEPPMQEPTIDDINFTQGFLRTQIGKRVKVDFLIGTNMIIDKEGTLMKVGVSYIVLREINTGVMLMADIYSIKFVEIFGPGTNVSSGSF